MKVIALDTGASTGVAMFDEAGQLIKTQTVGEIITAFNLILATREPIVLVEDAGNQAEYRTLVLLLEHFKIPYWKASPGLWKPNPQCATRAKDHPGTTQHERDAISLYKFWRLSRRNAERAK